jgi:DNA processing protein
VSACPECLRRCALLGILNERLEYVGRDPERLVALLELTDEQLLEALGGVRLGELQARYEAFDPAQPPPDGVERICRHDPRYPAAFAQDKGAPRMLHLSGGAARLGQLLSEPAVAIVGTRTASDYGLEVAHGLARGLAATGVTVIAGLADGIAAAALAGALEGGGRTVSVMAGGVDRCHPARRRALYRRVHATGCAVAELPCDCRPRGWCHTARARVVVALARLVIVVEADERPGELVHARLARAANTALAAVPGRVSAPGARGPHALLREGALLVRGAQDALDALYGVGVRRAPREHEQVQLDGQARKILEQVAAGRDTVARLAADGRGEQETLVALARLELQGRLARGDAGRYLPRL